MVANFLVEKLTSVFWHGIIIIVILFYIFFFYRNKRGIFFGVFFFKIAADALSFVTASILSSLNLFTSHLNQVKLM